MINKEGMTMQDETFKSTQLNYELIFAQIRQ